MKIDVRLRRYCNLWYALNISYAFTNVSLDLVTLTVYKFNTCFEIKDEILGGGLDVAIVAKERKSQKHET